MSKNPVDYEKIQGELHLKVFENELLDKLEKEFGDWSNSNFKTITIVDQGLYEGIDEHTRKQKYFYAVQYYKLK